MSVQGPTILLPAVWMIHRSTPVGGPADFGATVIHPAGGLPLLLVGEAFHLSGHPSAAISPRNALALADFLRRQALRLLDEERGAL